MTNGKSTRPRRQLIACLLGMGMTMAAAANEPHPYKELLESSFKDKKGLIFYVKGHAIPGAVTRLIGESAVEVKNREYGRIIIRLDRVDAIAAN